jgi:preprotein translocase subunit SecA
MAEAAGGGATNGSGLAAGAGGGAVGVTNRMADDGETQLPIVKSEKEKIGRNEPCWCGSGKKFKFCHGAN